MQKKQTKRIIRTLALLMSVVTFILVAQTEIANSKSVNPKIESSLNKKNDLVEIMVLGVAQDAGYPQLNCYQPHCLPGWQNSALKRMATSLAIIDHQHKRKYVFEATPDIKTQFYRLNQIAPDTDYRLQGIFLTHAHMGHYTGLMHLGREAAGTKEIAVYAMPKMALFLKTNGPWSQLVQLENIQLKSLAEREAVTLEPYLKAVPFKVPHRDEYSETVGFKITGPNKTALFIPDIDKWEKWTTDIRDIIKEVDYAFLDATFFDSDELPNRDMSEIPHPLVEESMQLFENFSLQEKQKVIFIHFNHSNPLLVEESAAQKKVIEAGFRFAVEGMRLTL